MKKVKEDPLMLEEDAEDALVDLIQASPCLYDKTLNVFKNVKAKDELWRNKAKELKCTLSQLMKWWATRQTRFGKLTREGKSGDPGTKPLTEKEKWILKKLAFLEVHIMRHQGKTTGGLDSVLSQNVLALGIQAAVNQPLLPLTPPAATAESEDDDDDDFEILVEESPASPDRPPTLLTPTSSQPSASQPPSSQPPSSLPPVSQPEGSATTSQRPSKKRKKSLKESEADSH
jgi:hypothetical protein